MKYAPFEDSTMHTEPILSIYKINGQYDAIKVHSDKSQNEKGVTVLFPDTMRWSNVFNKHDNAHVFENVVMLSGSPPETFRLQGDASDTLIEYYYHYDAVHDVWTLPSTKNVDTWIRVESN